MYNIVKTITIKTGNLFLDKLPVFSSFVLLVLTNQRRYICIICCCICCMVSGVTWTVSGSAPPMTM